MMTPSPWLAFLLLSLTGLPPRQAPVTPGAPERVADGVELHRLADPALLDPAGPVAIQALRLDPGKVRFQIAVAAHQNPARETVDSIAVRAQAIAAVNGGFFALADGKPAAMLKVGGRLLGGTTRARGAVAFRDHRGKTELLFDRVTVQSRQ